MRLLVAAILGALIGLERELHEHPAGMRTHLLVSVGSAAFTVLSVEAFHVPGSDPGRVAAQVVSGIGFLGAGAILKEGATVRGLTTAASLWAVAAVGMAVGTGAWGVAIVATIIVIVSLWPLRLVAERFIVHGTHRLSIHLMAEGPHALGTVIEAVTDHHGTVDHLASQRSADGRLRIELEVRVPDPRIGADLVVTVSQLPGVDLAASTTVD